MHHLQDQQEGLVLASKIVPDDTRVHVCELLQQVLLTPQQKVTTKVIYTDDVAKDQGPIQHMFTAMGHEVRHNYSK